MSDHPNSYESQPPSSEQGATKKSKSKPVLLGIAAVAVVALIAGGSFAFFSGYNPFGDPEPDYAQTPSQSDVMDFSGLSADMRLNGAPLTASAEAGETSPEILRFIGSTTSILTQVGDDEKPAWTVSIPHQDIDTGETAPLDEALGPDASDDTSDDEEKLAGTPTACRVSGDAVQCGDRAVALSDGSMTTAESKADVDPDPASSRVPLDIDDEGAVTGPDDQTYDGLNLGPEAHVSMIAGPQAGETGPWVVSDGQTLAAVDSDSVLWTQDLDPSAAEVTGLGDKRVTPSWTAVDGVLIIGTSGGVKGLDVSTGDQLWAVSAPTDGFAVTGSQLRIQHEGAVSSFDFTDSSDDESVTADKGFDESISALPAPKLPSEDDIRNAKLEVPPACADLTMAEGAKQAFADGKTAEGDYGSSIAINDVTTSVATPKPMVAIDFVCYPGGNWVTDSVGVYDQKLNLVTSIEPWSEDSDFQQLADFNRSIVSAIDLTGPYMTATVSNIAVYGDEEYNAAERTGEAELRFAWSKGGYDPQDALFTADGETVRVPEVEAVQKFVDAAAKGDDGTAGAMATDEVMRDLDIVIGDASANPPLTYRNVALQDGTEVDTCELIGVVDEEYGDYTMSNGVGLMEGIGGFGADSIKAGDVICGLKGPGETIDPDEEGSWYAAHLLLKGNEAGAVKVYSVSSYTG
ncbi:MAG: PQQ-like beta-propeller repeat protein [Brevibacterium sp.]|nr:PQQ-like beta-propeller repeat protein [Brevibacterium sp.]